MTEAQLDKPAIARIFAAQRANRVALKKRDAAGRIAQLEKLRAATAGLSSVLVMAGLLMGSVT